MGTKETDGRTVDPHANYFDSWQTPREWAGWARRTMGAIDLDPCGSAAADDVVRAWSTIRVEDGGDGLAETWHGRVYCNPPGDRHGRSVPKWWRKAHDHLVAGELEALVFCFFNWEAVITVRPDPLLVDGFWIIPVRRIGFLRDGGPIKSPRNRAAFWSSVRPAEVPETSYVIPTGSADVGYLLEGGADGNA